MGEISNPGKPARRVEVTPAVKPWWPRTTPAEPAPAKPAPVREPVPVP